MPTQQERLPENSANASGSLTPLTLAAAERIDTLENENRKLRITVRRLQQLAFIDGLTGLPNRRHLDTALQREIRRARRTGAPIGFAICDVDFFKRINDEVGHPAGDAVLRVLGRLLVGQCRRGGDFAARYGGEEFALLMPGVDSREMLRVAERTRHMVAKTPIRCGFPSRVTHVTVSIGVTSLAPRILCFPAGLVNAADSALYRAKRAGRNRVRFEPVCLR